MFRAANGVERAIFMIDRSWLVECRALKEVHLNPYIFAAKERMLFMVSVAELRCRVQNQIEMHFQRIVLAQQLYQILYFRSAPHRIVHVLCIT